MARVIVGDVNAAGLAKTRMAKSVLDAGWSMFREQLRYKALRHGVAFEVVSEKWTTQTCSDCASIGGPKGIAGLGMRHWTCSDCGASHDRDVNAARNLLFCRGGTSPSSSGNPPSFRAEKTLNDVAAWPWLGPATSAHWRRQIQLSHPQTLISDIGGEIICDRENAPKPGNHVLPPGKRGAGVMPYPVHLNERRHDRGTRGEYLVDGCGEFVSPARLIRQGPNLQRTVDRKCDELPDPKELDVFGGRRPFVLGQQKHDACIRDDGKYDTKCSRRKAVLFEQPPGDLLF